MPRDSTRAAERKKRLTPTILVRIPGFPRQDPGRLIVYDCLRDSTFYMAKKFVETMYYAMPEYEWSCQMLSGGQIRAIKRAPFKIAELDLEVKMPGVYSHTP